MTGAEAPWVNLLIQIPLVGIFVWFVLKRDSQYQAAQDRRDSEWRTFLKQHQEAFLLETKRLYELMLAHDDRVRDAIPAMKDAIDAKDREKTRPRRTEAR